MADLNDFSGIGLHTKMEPGKFKNVRPHITRTVKRSPHGKSFPLFARSVEHNQTIEGIEECELQMTRERKRRKKEQLPILTEEAAKAFRSFAKFSKIRTKPIRAR